MEGVLLCFINYEYIRENYYKTLNFLLLNMLACYFSVMFAIFVVNNLQFFLHNLLLQLYMIICLHTSSVLFFHTYIDS